MKPRATFTSPLSSALISGRGASTRWFVRVQAGLALLLACAMLVLLPASVAANEAKMTVNLDGKTVFLPEIKLTRKINPVTAFLYVGSWESNALAKVDQKPLCSLDLKNNRVVIESPETLLENSKTRVVNRENLSHFLDGITWGKRQATHFAFQVVSDRRQPAVIEIYTDSDAVIFNNGTVVSSVTAESAVDAGGRGYLPIMLETGENILNIKQYSLGEPRIQAAIFLDHSLDLQAAWQTQSGLLKKFVHAAQGRSGIPELDWNPYLSNFSVSLEVRDVSTNDIVLRKESARRGKLFNDEAQNFAPGIYEIAYRAGNENASELFVVGNPKDLFAALNDKLASHNTTPESKLDIEAQLRRARLLLADDNYNLFDRQWQEKIAYTFSCLATMERQLKEGAVDIAKDQPGLHIRGFASSADNSFQSYRLFVPSTYRHGAPLPLLVMISTNIINAGQPFIAGPVMANHREALLWAKYAEKHGFALLWPGYRGDPRGYTYESTHINEAIHAVEKDYSIDEQRISVYATCGAGYHAGRLISEYNNRFAGIVYDRAVFDLPSSEQEHPVPSLAEWLEASSPIPHVIANRNLKIFVMHDNTKPVGHGQMELTTQFLAQAGKIRDDVVSYLSKQPMSEASRMDMIFSWLAPCRNMKPSDARSHYLEQSGYQGPIMEIFTTPIIIVVGSHALDNGREIMQNIAASIRADYMKYFHGAECLVKKDDDVTEDDIKTHSLILIGNPTYNSVWEKLQPRIPLKISLDQVLYKNKPLAKGYMFEAITRHPDTADKYILMIGTGDAMLLQPVITDNLFNAWYDCLVFSTPLKIISKLDAHADARSDK